MRAALALALRGLGTVAPNPSVGCILVKEGKVVGRGWTQPGGRPHAETEALRRAGEAARGATAYVTLEPCSHVGKTGPCADALIAAGVARAVVAMEDPDVRVAGRGLKKLNAAGISVELGCCAEEAARLNRGFLLHRTENRPLVLLKLATSLDGKIATALGESKWITGPNARAHAQLLRASHDAILVGIGTALADDPALTRRLPGVQSQLLRVVLDGKGRLPAGAKLCDGTAPSLQITAPDCKAAVPDGIERAVVPLDGERLSVPGVLTALAERGITRVMIEGGGRVAAAFLDAGMVDRIAWYRAGRILGAPALGAVGALSYDRLAQAPDFIHRRTEQIGPDQVDWYEKP